MSNNDQASTSASQQTQQRRVVKPPLADWPTIKILTPPQGRFSPKVDEWCFTYCTQSVTGRIHGKEPECRSICVRKVFPHEVRNIVSFKRHKKVDAEGKAHYPLPPEGQTTNLPRLLGGKAPVEDSDDDDRGRRSSDVPTKHWDEGWYFWTSKSMKERAVMMSLDLEKQQAFVARDEQRRELWQEYQDKLKQGENEKAVIKQYGGKWTSVLSPPLTSSEQRAKALLVRLPPDLPPLWERIDKLLAPTRHALQILKDSVMSGEQRDFAVRIWEKARTDEPFILAQRTLSRAYEVWKDKDTTDEDGKKPGST